MKDTKTVELIEKYLSGKLHPQERANFERQLLSDPILAKKTSSYRDSLGNHLSSGRDKIKSGIIAVGKKGSTIGKSVVNINQKKNFLKTVGIFLIILIGISSAFLIIDKAPDYESLFTEFYTSLSYHHMASDEDLGEIDGIHYFQNGEYQRAIPALEKDIIARPGEARLYLYLGLSYLETDTDGKAKLNFEKAESLSEGNLRNSAIWYLALTQLKLNQLDDARENLAELVKQGQNSIYFDPAKNLIKEI